jgi:hypothetical protein
VLASKRNDTLLFVMGRPSIHLELMIRMLVVAYVFGSDRGGRSPNGFVAAGTPIIGKQGVRKRGAHGLNGRGERDPFNSRPPKDVLQR